MRLAHLVVLLIAACGPSSALRHEDPPSGYLPASTDVRDGVVAAVRSYYALRARAVAAWDLTELYRAYPDLAAGEDRGKGVNVEGFFVERMRALTFGR